MDGLENTTSLSIVTRSFAKANGLPRYYPGTTCKYGHLAERRTDCRACVECDEARKATRAERRKRAAEKWRKANRALAKSRSDVWKAKYPDRQKRAEDSYRLNNREKCRAAGLEWWRRNKEQQAVIQRAWRLANRPLLAAKSAQRRAVKRKAQPAWANESKIAEIYAIAAWMTANSGEIWHVDHIVPLVSTRVCGLHCEANLTILPAGENLSKSNRYWPDMFEFD